MPVPPHSLFIERGDLDTDRIALATVRAKAESLAVELAQRTHDLTLAAEQARLQTEAANQARADAAAAEGRRMAAEARGDALERDLVAVTRSFRTFWRRYWPNFQRHWLGR